MTERKKPKDPLDHEPEAVTWARRKAGLTRAQLAARIGVSAGLVSEIEKGTRNATPARIRDIAEALNCPAVFLERKRTAAATAA
jgi:transcriptional regulator with XRE-family HTH domain